MTSTLNSQIIARNEEITGRGVSNDLFHDERRPEPGFDNINVVIRSEVMSFCLWWSYHPIPNYIYSILNFSLFFRVRPISGKQTPYAERRDQSSVSFPDAGQIQVLFLSFI